MKFVNIISQLLLIITILFLTMYTGQLINEKEQTIFKLGVLNVNRNAVIVLFFNFIVIGIFTLIYYYVSNFTNEAHFLKNGKPYKLDLLNAMYECLITQTTVGYGDIEYKSNIIKLINMLQMSTLFINFGLFNI